MQIFRDRGSLATMATNNPPAVEFKSAPPPQAAQLEPLPPSPRPPTSLQNPESCINSIFKPPQRGEDYTILQAVFSIDMLVLFISASCGHMELPRKSSARLLVGIPLNKVLPLSPPTLHSHTPHFLSRAPSHCLRHPQLSLLRFMASPVGAYLLNVKVAGQLYDKEALKQLGAKGLERQLGQDLTCVGVKCYRLSFVIITVATLIGCFASVVLVFRTRKFYRGDIYRKYREEVEVVGMEVGLASTPVDQSKFEQR
ncbi:unnamed protein product [Camellia sinensis]